MSFSESHRAKGKTRTSFEAALVQLRRIKAVSCGIGEKCLVRAVIVDDNDHGIRFGELNELLANGGAEPGELRRERGELVCWAGFEKIGRAHV